MDKTRYLALMRVERTYPRAAGILVPKVFVSHKYPSESQWTVDPGWPAKTIPAFRKSISPGTHGRAQVRVPAGRLANSQFGQTRGIIPLLCDNVPTVALALMLLLNIHPNIYPLPRLMVLESLEDLFSFSSTIFPFAHFPPFSYQLYKPNLSPIPVVMVSRREKKFFERCRR